MSTAVDWHQTYRERATRQAARAQEQGIQVHALNTSVGRIYLTFEGCEHGALAGTVWTDAPVRVNHREWTICAGFRYFLSDGCWLNGQRVTHDPPLPCASFPGSDMLRAGNHRATANATHKAELAIGAAIAALDRETGGCLTAHAALNETELAAQAQDHHAQRARDRAAEWIAHAERHERNARALRAGQTPTDYDLAERRVW